MVRLSLDNGMSYPQLDEISDNELLARWDALVALMDDVARERAHCELAPCTEREFLARYLALAPCDLVLG